MNLLKETWRGPPVGMNAVGSCKILLFKEGLVLGGVYFVDRLKNGRKLAKAKLSSPTSSAHSWYAPSVALG